MINIGKNNTLKVARLSDFGAYLTDEENSAEVLLPSRYLESVPEVGQEMDVFVYNDSDDRPVAVTDKPHVRVGEFSLLEVVAVNKVGAFLDWGLPKDLLVPFSEQKVRLHPGMRVMVYVYLDDASKRVVASAKIEKFLGNVPVDYSPGDKVKAMVWQHNDIGCRCIVDNLHSGIFYDNELFRELEIGEVVDAYVRHVRDDGKIDLTLSGSARERSNKLADMLLSHARDHKGILNLTDSSSPEEIRKAFGCSKKDFKKAVGHLLREGKMEYSPDKQSLFVRRY